VIEDEAPDRIEEQGAARRRVERGHGVPAVVGALEEEVAVGRERALEVVRRALEFMIGRFDGYVSPEPPHSTSEGRR